MKKRINLLRQKKHSDFLSLYIPRIKLIGTIIGLVAFCFFLYFIFMIINLKKEIEMFSKLKQSYLNFLVKEKDFESNVRFFKGKQTNLDRFLKDDASFLPYYELMSSVLSKYSSESAVLDRIEIDKEKKTVFTVKFNNYEEMISFLKYIESNDFLDNFTNISLASFSVGKDKKDSTSKDYRLQFEAKFKEINDKKTGF